MKSSKGRRTRPLVQVQARKPDDNDDGDDHDNDDDDDDEGDEDYGDEGDYHCKERAYPDYNDDIDDDICYNGEDDD